MKNFQDQVVVITGASGGIGKATVKSFLDKGAVVMASDVDKDDLKSMKEEILVNEDRLKTFIADVTKEEDVKNLIDKAVLLFDKIDILVNNAGFEGKVAPFEKQTLENYQKVMDVNVKGVFLGMKYAFPHLEKTKGNVVNISSVAGLRGSANVSPYIASKHAVSGLTKTGALEGGPKGIRVNSVHPSPVDNRMMRSLEEGFAPEQPEAVKKGLEESIPLGRYATNEEVASLITFLASEDAKFINGVQYRIDGGMGAL